MDHAWIAFAVFGALMQAVRTAAQRDLSRQLSTLATSYVRALFALPFLIVYLACVLWVNGGGVPRFTTPFLFTVTVGSIAQAIATLLLIAMFQLRNFAVGTMLTKADVLITAGLGWALFSEVLTPAGVAALAVVLAGVVLMSAARLSRADLAPGGRSLIGLVSDRPTRVALACATAFAVSYLCYREAALMLPGDFLTRAAWTVTAAFAIQTVLVGLYVAKVEPQAFAQLAATVPLSTFIGLTSALGSIAWFTAFALQNASYVRAVGQVEVVFTLLVSALYYRERIRPTEYAGIALTVAGVVLFRLIG